MNRSRPKPPALIINSLKYVRLLTLSLFLWDNEQYNLSKKVLGHSSDDNLSEDNVL